MLFITGKMIAGYTHMISLIDVFCTGNAVAVSLWGFEAGGRGGYSLVGYGNTGRMLNL